MKNDLVFVVLFEQECGYVSPGLEAIFSNESDAIDFADKKNSDSYAPSYWVESRVVK